MAPEGEEEEEEGGAMRPGEDSATLEEDAGEGNATQRLVQVAASERTAGQDAQTQVPQVAAATAAAPETSAEPAAAPAPAPAPAAVPAAAPVPAPKQKVQEFVSSVKIGSSTKEPKSAPPTTGVATAPPTLGGDSAPPETNGASPPPTIAETAPASPTDATTSTPADTTTTSTTKTTSPPSQSVPTNPPIISSEPETPQESSPPTTSAEIFPDANAVPTFPPSIASGGADLAIAPTIALAPTIAQAVQEATQTIAATLAPTAGNAIGEGVYVISNSTGGGQTTQTLAIDAITSNLQHSHAFEPPQGWDSIGVVCLFGLVVFLPVAATTAIAFYTHAVRDESTTYGKLHKGFSLAWSQLRAAFYNMVRLRHCRGEDLENLGSEGALYLSIHRETAVLVAMMTVVGCSVLLPLHLSAGDETVTLDFTRSTIQHLRKHSPLLWVHTASLFVFSFLYFRYVSRCRQHVQWSWKHGVIGARSLDMWDASVFIKSKFPEDLGEKETKRLLGILYPGQVSNVIVIMDNTEASRVERRVQQIEQDLRTLRQFAAKTSFRHPQAAAAFDKAVATVRSAKLTKREARALHKGTSPLTGDYARAKREDEEGLENAKTNRSVRSPEWLHFEIGDLERGRRRRRVGRPAEDSETKVEDDIEASTSSVDAETFVTGSEPEASLPPQAAASLHQDPEADLSSLGSSVTNGDRLEDEDDEEDEEDEDEDASARASLLESTPSSRGWDLVSVMEQELRDLRRLEATLQARHSGKCIITFASADLAAAFADPIERRKSIRLAIESKVKFEQGAAKVALERAAHQRLDNIDNDNDDNNDDGKGELAEPEETRSFPPMPIRRLSSIKLLAQVESLHAEIERAHMYDWEAVPSPDPHDLIWESLHLDSRVYMMRMILVNVLIFIVLVALSMPASVLGLLSHMGKSTGSEEDPDVESWWLAKMDSLNEHHPGLAAFIFVFVPQLFIVTVNNMLMFVVSVLGKWEPHYTYSQQEKSSLRKTFWFLLLNTLFIPALAFKSLESFVGSLVSKDASPFALLGQVFVVTSGAFTLTYIITQTLVGAAFQLIDLSSIMSHCMLNGRLRCPWQSHESERPHLDRVSTFEFGSEYATFLSVLVLVVVFSTSVPIILPFGVVYFFVKICVDEYQLNHVYGRDKSHSVPRCRIGRAAVRYLPIPLLLYQIGTIGYFASYVCVSNEILPMAAGQHPRGCTVVSDADGSVAVPGTQVIRGTPVQLLLLFALFIYTASDALYVFMVDKYNDEGMIVGAGFADQPFVTEKQLRRRAKFLFDPELARSSDDSQTGQTDLSYLAYAHSLCRSFRPSTLLRKSSSSFSLPWGEGSQHGSSSETQMQDEDSQMQSEEKDNGDEAFDDDGVDHASSLLEHA